MAVSWSRSSGAGTQHKLEPCDLEAWRSHVCSARTSGAHHAKLTTSHQVAWGRGRGGHGYSGDNRSGDHGNDRVQRNGADANNCRHRWINRQITSAAGRGDTALLLEVVRAHLLGMNLINCSTALHRIAKLALDCNAEAREWIKEHESIRGLRAIASLNIERIWTASLPAGTSAANEAKRGSAVALASERQSEMRCVSIICWSCATLRVRDDVLLGRAFEITSARLAELKPFELSNLLWAFGKLSLGCEHGSFENLAPHILQRREGQFGLQCLSTIVWAFGTAKVYHPTMFASIAGEIGAQAHAMSPQGVANTVWAFARVRRQDAPLFRALAKAATSNLDFWSFKPQELSNIVWAFATVQLPSASLFDSVAKVAVARRHELRPPNVANLLWAYAKLASPSRAQLFSGLLEVAETVLEQYKPQEIAAIVWAAGKETGCPTCRHFLHIVPRAFIGRLRGFQPQALACSIEAFTLADVDAADFFDAMLRESFGRLRDFQAASLCTLFRGVLLTAQRRAVAGGPSLVAQLQILDEHIAGCIGQLQSHNVSHLKQTLDFVPSSVQASWAPSLVKSCTFQVAVSAVLPGGSAFDLSADTLHPSSAMRGMGGRNLGQFLQDSCELDAPDADCVLSDCLAASGDRRMPRQVVQDTRQEGTGTSARRELQQRSCDQSRSEMAYVNADKRWTPPPVLALAQALGECAVLGFSEAPTCSSTPAGSLRVISGSFDFAEQREVQRFDSESAFISQPYLSYFMPPPGL